MNQSRGRGFRGGPWVRGNRHGSPSNFRGGGQQGPGVGPRQRAGNFGPGWRGGGPTRGSKAPFAGDKSHGMRKFGKSNYESNRKDLWSKDKKNDKKQLPDKRLTENEIGVTEYISKLEGFNGIIKSRYSDFHVNEINLDGEEAILTDLTVPEPPKTDNITDDEEHFQQYKLELLPAETWDRIDKLAKSKDMDAQGVEVDATGMTKEERTKIHDTIKQVFGSAIIGSTVTTDDKKIVRFEKYRKGVRVDRREKWLWPGDYVYFVLHKYNCDTMEAANRIAECLNMNTVKPGILGYAGTKDRRAKTSQWFSVRRVDPRKIAKSATYLRNMQIGNFRFKDSYLKLGMLKGNRFRIALRNIVVDDEIVNKSCESFKQNGFINYYGLQRFGTRLETPTYSIGLNILLGKLKEAVNAILELRPCPQQQALLHYRETGDAAGAVELLPPHSNRCIEGRLLLALARQPSDLLGAINSLSRNTRMLYAHSYQSLIWNQCASERVRLYRLNPAVGDLVLASPSDYNITEVVEDDEESDEEDLNDSNSGCKQSFNKTELNSVDDKSADPMEGVESVKVKNNSKHNEPRPKVPVKILTKEDIESGKYTISDIVLPLPGWNIDYPPNLKNYYEELLKKDNLTLQITDKLKAFYMSGAYRCLVARPEAMSWKCVRYSNPFGDLIQSDADVINGVELKSIVPDGKYKALLLDFILPASCYATMALRELLKVDTSGDNQAAQNDYHKEPSSDIKENLNKEIITETPLGDSESKTDIKPTLEIKKDLTDDIDQNNHSQTANLSEERLENDVSIENNDESNDKIMEQVKTDANNDRSCEVKKDSEKRKLLESNGADESLTKKIKKE